MHSSFLKACIVGKQDMHIQGQNTKHNHILCGPITGLYVILQFHSEPRGNASANTEKVNKNEAYYFFSPPLLLQLRRRNRLLKPKTEGKHIQNNSDGTLRYGTDVGIWARRVFSPVRGSLVPTSGPLPALFLTDKTHNSHIHWRPLSSEIKNKTKRLCILSTRFTQACFFFFS